MWSSSALRYFKHAVHFKSQICSTDSNSAGVVVVVVEVADCCCFSRADEVALASMCWRTTAWEPDNGCEDAAEAYAEVPRFDTTNWGTLRLVLCCCWEVPLLLADEMGSSMAAEGLKVKPWIIPPRRGYNVVLFTPRGTCAKTGVRIPTSGAARDTRAHWTFARTACCSRVRVLERARARRDSTFARVAPEELTVIPTDEAIGSANVEDDVDSAAGASISQTVRTISSTETILLFVDEDDFLLSMSVLKQDVNMRP